MYMNRWLVREVVGIFGRRYYLCKILPVPNLTGEIYRENGKIWDTALKSEAEELAEQLNK